MASYTNPLDHSRPESRLTERAVKPCFKRVRHLQPILPTMHVRQIALVEEARAALRREHPRQGT